MGLSDPELDLLLEVLTDEPSDPVFIDVAAEYARREDWSRAVDVLRASRAAGAADERGWRLLADVAFHDERFDVALDAVEALESPGAELLRLSIRCCHRLGRVHMARTRCDAYLALVPDDEEVLALRSQLTISEQAPSLHGLDPFYSVERAEEYVARGWSDRAARVLRRVQYRHPDDPWIAARIDDLRGRREPGSDDLSEEIGVDLEAPPPDLTMPSADLGPAEPVASPFPAASRFPVDDDDEYVDFEPTMLFTSPLVDTATPTPPPILELEDEPMAWVPTGTSRLDALSSTPVPGEPRQVAPDPWPDEVEDDGDFEETVVFSFDAAALQRVATEEKTVLFGAHGSAGTDDAPNALEATDPGELVDEVTDHGLVDEEVTDPGLARTDPSVRRRTRFDEQDTETTAPQAPGDATRRMVRRSTVRRYARGSSAHPSAGGVDGADGDSLEPLDPSRIGTPGRSRRKRRSLIKKS